jgi:hypothetical protein
MNQKWFRVTKQWPCPVCKKPDWCAIGEQFINCMRVQSDKDCRNGGWLHPKDENAIRHAPVLAPQEDKQALPVDCLSPWIRYNAGTSNERIVEFAALIGLDPAALWMYGAAWEGRAWVWPMWNGAVMCGLRYRNEHGDKWSLKGGKQGLFIPSRLPSLLALAGHTLTITEGPTDAAAALMLGLAAVGRPSCLGCERHIAELIARYDVERVVLIGDNDNPGEHGAVRLQASLRIPSCVWTPPCKDLREYVITGGTADLMHTALKDLGWQMPARNGAALAPSTQTRTERERETMPNINEIKESKYLKKEDVGAGALLTISGCVQQNVAQEGQPEDLKWCLQFEESEKPMVLNITNATLIAEVCGSENTDDWAGHKIVLFNDPTVMYAGKRMGGIRARAPKTQAAPAPAKPAAPKKAALPAAGDIPY